MFLIREFRHFQSLSHNLRVLLTANVIYTLMGPISELFTSAFVMRNTQDVRLVMAYQLAFFVGIPLSCLGAGWLFRVLAIRWICASGYIGSGLALAAMMSLPELSVTGIIAIGLGQGLSQGLMWSSRNVLAVACVEDDSRNYYSAIENGFGILAGIVVPLVIGGFIEITGRYGGDRNQAYLLMSLGGLLLAITAAAVLQRGRFPQPPTGPFLFWRFPPLWRRLQWLIIARGLSQGILIAVPTMLVLTLVGGEGALGLVQSIGGLLAALLLYRLGRWATPEHRSAILALGLGLIACGSLANALLFNVAGVLIFTLSLLLGRPLMELALSPIVWRTTEVMAQREGRSVFAYLMSAELCYLIGRVLGCGLFIAAASCISEEAALRWTLVAVVAVQVLAMRLVPSIVAECQSAGSSTSVPGGSSPA